MRLACKQLVATLKPHFAEAGENATWQEVILKVHPEVGFNASKARDSLYLFHILVVSCDLFGELASTASHNVVELMLVPALDGACMLHCVHRLLIAAVWRFLAQETMCYVACAWHACSRSVYG